MFKQIVRKFSANKNISLNQYVKDYANMTNKQLDMIRNHMNAQHETMKWQIILTNQMVLAGFAGAGYMFLQVDKRFEHVEQSIAEIKQLIVQSNASK